MQFVYPIQAILLYLSILFAPADTERILFHGPDRSGVLIRDASGWNLAGPEGNTVVVLDGSRLISKGAQPGVIDLVNLVGGVAGHDWTKDPTLYLADDKNLEAVVVERTADGLKVRNDRGREGIYAYTIAYVRKGKESDSTCNVLGAVKQPGILLIQEGDTLSSLVGKAGGTTGKATPNRVFILRGKPGEPVSYRESFPLSSLFDGHGPDPKVLDHDTIYIEPTVLLAFPTDGSIPVDVSLAVDGQDCPTEELAARLRDRVEAGVRSARILAGIRTPNGRITEVHDACIAAGMPATAISLEVRNPPVTE